MKRADVHRCRKPDTGRRAKLIAGTSLRGRVASEFCAMILSLLMALTMAWSVSGCSSGAGADQSDPLTRLEQKVNEFRDRKQKLNLLIQNLERDREAALWQLANTGVESTADLQDNQTGMIHARELKKISEQLTFYRARASELDEALRMAEANARDHRRRREAEEAGISEEELAGAIDTLVEFEGQFSDEGLRGAEIPLLDFDDVVSRELAAQKEQVRYRTITNSIGMELVFIPAGEFLMGSHGSSERDKPRRIRISRPFYMGVYECTQAEFDRLMDKEAAEESKSESGSETDAERSLPATGVSWKAAMEFCRRLSDLPAEKEAGRRYQLPTEAQWEYACRAGTTTRYHYGDEINANHANCDAAWPGRPVPGGRYKPNAFGLYDMHGNVWEWCMDFYSSKYLRTAPEVDPKGPADGSDRVARGGGWNRSPADCTSSTRIDLGPFSETYGYVRSVPNLGFRVIMVQ